MSERKQPIWKHRVAFSKSRNISVVLWPPGEYEGHPTPPSVTLEEGAYDSEKKVWINTRMNLTLDKLPNIVQDLMVAYSKALDLRKEKAPEEPTKPRDAVGYVKEMALSEMVDRVVYDPKKLTEIIRAKAEWVGDEEIKDAVAELIEENKLKPVFRGLDFQGYTRV